MHTNGKHDGWGEPILTIDDFEPARPCVRLYGELFAFLHPMDLSLAQEARFNALQREFDALRAAEALRAEELGEAYTEQPETAAQLSDRLGQILQIIILDLPDAVLDRIPDRRRMQLLQVFGEARAGNLPAPSPTPTPIPKRSPPTPTPTNRGKARARPASHSPKSIGAK
jgi:hypothetical protein